MLEQGGCKEACLGRPEDLDGADAEDSAEEHTVEATGGSVAEHFSIPTQLAQWSLQVRTTTAIAACLGCCLAACELCAIPRHDKHSVFGGRVFGHQGLHPMLSEWVFNTNSLFCAASRCHKSVADEDRGPDSLQVVA